MERLFLIGGSGFIGKNFVNQKEDVYKICIDEINQFVG